MEARLGGRINLAIFFWIAYLSIRQRGLYAQLTFKVGK